MSSVSSRSRSTRGLPLLGIAVALIAATGMLLPDLGEARGDRGGGDRGANKSVAGANQREKAGNANRNKNVNRNKNTNINRNTNVNVNNRRDVDVDIDVDRGGCCRGDWDIDVDHHHHGGALAAGIVIGAMAVTTAAVVGSSYYALPPGCTVVYTYGPPYHYCGSVYYEQRYQGSQVTYVVVNP
jgi:hypothetical protein